MSEEEQEDDTQVETVEEIRMQMSQGQRNKMGGKKRMKEHSPSASEESESEREESDRDEAFPSNDTGRGLEEDDVEEDDENPMMHSRLNNMHEKRKDKAMKKHVHKKFKIKSSQLIDDQAEDSDGSDGSMEQDEDEEPTEEDKAFINDGPIKYAKGKGEKKGKAKVSRLQKIRKQSAQDAGMNHRVYSSTATAADNVKAMKRNEQLSISADAFQIHAMHVKLNEQKVLNEEKLLNDQKVLNEQKASKDKKNTVSSSSRSRSPPPIKRSSGVNKKLAFESEEEGEEEENESKTVKKSTPVKKEKSGEKKKKTSSTPSSSSSQVKKEVKNDAEDEQESTPVRKQKVEPKQQSASVPRKSAASPAATPKKSSSSNSKTKEEAFPSTPSPPPPSPATPSKPKWNGPGMEPLSPSPVRKAKSVPVHPHSEKKAKHKDTTTQTKLLPGATSDPLTMGKVFRQHGKTFTVVFRGAEAILSEDKTYAQEHAYREMFSTAKAFVSTASGKDAEIDDLAGVPFYAIFLIRSFNNPHMLTLPEWTKIENRGVKTESLKRKRNAKAKELDNVEDLGDGKQRLVTHAEYYKKLVDKDADADKLKTMDDVYGKECGVLMKLVLDDFVKKPKGQVHKLLKQHAKVWKSCYDVPVEERMDMTLKTMGKGYIKAFLCFMILSDPLGKIRKMLPGLPTSDDEDVADSDEEEEEEEESNGKENCEREENSKEDGEGGEKRNVEGGGEEGDGFDVEINQDHDGDSNDSINEE